MTTFKTSDGVSIAYDDSGGDGPALIMLHGWGFSRRFFDDVAEPLGSRHRVIRPDLRGHGDSGCPPWQIRLARLGVDLDELVRHLDLSEAVVLGWSLGTAVIWSCLENARPAWLRAAVFCSQVPRQYIDEDWPWHHAQCYDEVGLARFQADLRYDYTSMISSQVDEICARPVSAPERELYRSEMVKCDARVRAQLMADHTRQDWRDFLPSIDMPVLVMSGQQDRAYDWHGVAWIAEQILGARHELFPDSAHAIFHDEPAHFVAAVENFVASLSTNPRH